VPEALSDKHTAGVGGAYQQEKLAALGLAMIGKLRTKIDTDRTFVDLICHVAQGAISSVLDWREEEEEGCKVARGGDRSLGIFYSTVVEKFMA